MSEVTIVSWPLSCNLLKRAASPPAVSSGGRRVACVESSLTGIRVFIVAPLACAGRVWLQSTVNEFTFHRGTPRKLQCQQNRNQGFGALGTNMPVFSDWWTNLEDDKFILVVSPPNWKYFLFLHFFLMEGVSFWWIFLSGSKSLYWVHFNCAVIFIWD